MRPKSAHAALSSVGEHTTRESESAKCCAAGKERVAHAHPHFEPGTARSRVLCFAPGRMCFAVRPNRGLASQQGLDPSRVGIMVPNAGGHHGATLMRNFNSPQTSSADPGRPSSCCIFTVMTCAHLTSMSDCVRPVRRESAGGTRRRNPGQTARDEAFTIGFLYTAADGPGGGLFREWESYFVPA